MAKDDELWIRFEGLKQRLDSIDIAVAGQGTQRDADFDELQQLKVDVVEILERLNLREPEFLLSPWWWPTMTASQAEEAWKTLTEWVDEVIIGRYEAGQNSVPSSAIPLNPDTLPLPFAEKGGKVMRCWFAHPSMVDKLSALFWARKGDYRRNAPANGPLEWQENWLPKTLEQLDHEFRTTHCQGTCPHLKEARPNMTHKSLVLRDRMNYIEWDVGRRPN